MAAPVGAVATWFSVFDACIPLPERSPCQVASPEDQFGPDAKVLGTPEHDVSEPAGGQGAHVSGHAMGDGRVDRVFGQVTQHALVVVGPEAVVGERFCRPSAGPADRWGARPALPGRLGPPGLHRVGELPCPADRLPDAAHSLRVAVDDADPAQLVQRPFRRHGGRVEPFPGEFNVCWVVCRAAPHSSCCSSPNPATPPSSTSKTRQPANI